MTFSFFAALLTGSALLVNAGPPVAPATTASVTINVSALASTQATVKLYFYNRPAGFLKEGQYAFSRAVKPGGQSSVTVPVELTPGDWAVALTQDTNNNDKLDKNFLGIPTEPYAFSNNVRPTVAPPDFADCKFTVEGPGKVVNIALK
jgi:uncharacterized protein (DUF2141 family)